MVYTNFEVEALLSVAGYEVERRDTTVIVSSNGVKVCTIYKNGRGKVLIWFRPVVRAHHNDRNGHVIVENDIWPEHNVFWNHERFAKYKADLYNHYFLMRAWAQSYSSQLNRFALRETHFNSFVNELIAFAPTLIEHVKEAYKDYKRYVAERNLKHFHAAIKD